MILRRTLIFGTLGAIVPASAFAKRSKPTRTITGVQDAAMRIASEVVRPEYLPQPTRIQKIEGAFSEPMYIDNITRKDDIT